LTSSCIDTLMKQSRVVGQSVRWIGGVIAICAGAFAVGGCTSLFYAHDPQFGPMSRDQIPPFLQSLRCELITFYEANNQRHNLFDFYNTNHHRRYAVDNFPYFELSKELFGGIYLDLKVVDTANVPGSGTNFNQKTSFDAAHSTSWHAGPTFSDTNTYELVRSFLIAQNQTLSGPTITTTSYEAGDIPDADPFQCYKAIPQTAADRDVEKTVKPKFKVRDFDGLAQNNYPKLNQFQRIRVTGSSVLPLAAWIQENMRDSWSNFAAKDESIEIKENIIPTQITYSFTVQVQLGLDVSYSLATTRWNPLALDAGGSTQQTSFLQFVVNGPDAALAAGAKNGVATSAVDKLTTPLPQLPGGTATAPALPFKRGQLIYPLPLPLPQ
jgi:hypothetical protein